jgi:hypothetical protein
MFNNKRVRMLENTVEYLKERVATLEKEKPAKSVGVGEMQTIYNSRGSYKEPKVIDFDVAIKFLYDHLNLEVVTTPSVTKVVKKKKEK